MISVPFTIRIRLRDNGTLSTFLGLTQQERAQ